MMAVIADRHDQLSIGHRMNYPWRFEFNGDGHG
jgi:hypothetical protein